MWIQPWAKSLLTHLFSVDHGIGGQKERKKGNPAIPWTENMREHFLWFFLSFLDRTISILIFYNLFDRSGPRKEKEQEKVKR